MKFTDTIEARTKRDTKNPNVKKYGFKMSKTTDESGEPMWVNTINEKIGESLDKGDMAEFVIKENPPWGFDIVSAEKIVSPDTPAETGIKPKEEPTQSKPIAKDDHILRQVCLKCAQASLDTLSREVGDKDFDDKLQSHLDSVKKLMCGLYKAFTGNDW